MKRDDYILAITSGLLTVEVAAFDNAVNYFGQFYELQQPARPGFVSIAGADAQQSPVAFVEWIKAFRAEDVKEINFYWAFEQTHPSMPAHIEAAFAGSQSLQMCVVTAKQVSHWRLRTLMSSLYEMTAHQFAALMDAQQQKELLWRRVEEVVNESNRLNERRQIESEKMKEYLQGEGRDVYNFLVSQMITEVQVECEVLEQPFLIPEGFEGLLYKSDFGSFFGPADDRIPVFLYPTGKVTKEELQQLVNAQPFAAEVWGELEKSLAEYPLANIPSSGYPAALDSLDEAAVQEISHSVCRAIAERCGQHGAQPIIPAGLLHCIGPDELDGKRAQARSRLSGGNQYYLQSNQQPWELYLFTQVTDPGVSPAETSNVKPHFISVLKQISALALKMQTPFAEAFSSAVFLSGNDLPEGDFNEEHENRIAAAMQEKGFSDQAVHVFRNHFSYMKDLHLLGWSSGKIFGLCAISMADVFGGMGSWNDLDPGDDGLEYQRLSADLFETMKRYFATIIGM